jgi:xylulokinase
VTVGIDIGTTSVKAVAVDDQGNVVSRSRVPHGIVVPSPGMMEHDARRAWRSGPLKALSKLGAVDAKGVAVSAMVPSMTAVDRRGRPLTPGLLYGDERGRTHSRTTTDQGGDGTGPEGAGEIVGFLRWTAESAPRASGYWHAQAVANKALGGPPAVDLGVAFTSVPLFGEDGWDKGICNDCGVAPDQLASLELPGSQVGRLFEDGPPLAAGTVDVWCEQLVSGANQPGDVHVVCGTTLIVWAMGEEPATGPGLWSVGGAKGLHMVGGASNAGGLFLDWANRLIGRDDRGGSLDPANIPVWAPYPRGERTPYHDPSMRASLHGLDLTHGPAALRRAAWEASGFVVRHHLELAGVTARRLVVTGGGTKVEGWMQALADVTGHPVHVAADPEGAARGAAFIARVAAGLESDVNDAERWSRTGRIVEPDKLWARESDARYSAFLAHSGTPSAG